GGVRGGDVVEAVELLHFLAQSGAHDQPHDQLDTFRSGFAQEFEPGDRPEIVRAVDQLVEESVVEFRVDQASPRALQLVAHASGAPDLHIEVGRDRKSTRLNSSHVKISYAVF